MNSATNEAAATDPRQARGLALAQNKAKAFRQVVGDAYLVPSATNAGASYLVDMAAATMCTCPDYEERRLPCKHVWAVRFFRHEAPMSDGTTVVTEGFVKVEKRPTYKQDWPAYNAAASEEKGRVEVLLRALCDGIVEPKQERGRPRLALRDAVYAATMKVYGGMSGRRAMSDTRVSEERGLVGHAPCYNSTFNTLAREDLTPLFKVLVEQAAAPLRGVETSFAVDSTGFSTCTYARWFDAKYGEEKKVQRWIKAHAIVGTVTNVITAVEVTDGNANDCPHFSPLVERTKANGWDMREVSGDKAYLSHENLATVERVGAVPFVPFKVNSGSTGSAAWERMYHFYALNRDEFLRRYHKRSNVESTFSMVKRNFGESLRSKLFAAQVNETLLRCLCHNLSVLVHAIHELNVDPKFWMPQTAAESLS